MEADADHGLEPDRIVRLLRSSLDRLGVDHVNLTSPTTTIGRRRRRYRPERRDCAQGTGIS